MSNLREVNDDILKDWLNFREDTIASLTCAEDKKHFICFEEIAEKIWGMFPNRIRNMLRNSWNNLMIISLIIFANGMKSIIGMGFVMECCWLVDALNS